MATIKKSTGSKGSVNANVQKEKLASILDTMKTYFTKALESVGASEELIEMIVGSIVFINSDASVIINSKKLV